MLTEQAVACRVLMLVERLYLRRVGILHSRMYPRLTVLAVLVTVTVRPVLHQVTVVAAALLVHHPPDGEVVLLLAVVPSGREGGMAYTVVAKHHVDAPALCLVPWQGPQPPDKCIILQPLSVPLHPVDRPEAWRQICWNWY